MTASLQGGLQGEILDWPKQRQTIDSEFTRDKIVCLPPTKQQHIHLQALRTNPWSFLLVSVVEKSISLGCFHSLWAGASLGARMSIALGENTFHHIPASSFWALGFKHLNEMEYSKFSFIWEIGKKSKFRWCKNLSFKNRFVKSFLDSQNLCYTMFGFSQSRCHVFYTHSEMSRFRHFLMQTILVRISSQ